jgi:hypothetical protein
MKSLMKKSIIANLKSPKVMSLYYSINNTRSYITFWQPIGDYGWVYMFYDYKTQSDIYLKIVKNALILAMIISVFQGLSYFIY